MTMRTESIVDWHCAQHVVEMTTGMGIDDKIGNWNGKELETTCMVMGMALIPMGINSHRQLVLMIILFCIENNS